MCSHGEDVQGVHRAADHLKVVLEDGHGAGQRLVAAAAEQSHARVQQQGSDQRRVGDATQAPHTALQTPCNTQTYSGNIALIYWQYTGIIPEIYH